MAASTCKTLYLPNRPANGPKFRMKRDAEAVARFLTENGYEVEWVRRNWGGQGLTTWNIRLTDGPEIHSRNQLEDMGTPSATARRMPPAGRSSTGRRTTESASAGSPAAGRSLSPGGNAASRHRSVAGIATRATRARGAAPQPGGAASRATPSSVAETTAEGASPVTGPLVM